MPSGEAFWRPAGLNDSLRYFSGQKEMSVLLTLSNTETQEMAQEDDNGKQQR